MALGGVNIWRCLIPAQRRPLSDLSKAASLEAALTNLGEQGEEFTDYR
jgi:hypothetical protein